MAHDAAVIDDQTSEQWKDGFTHAGSVVYRPRCRPPRGHGVAEGESPHGMGPSAMPGEAHRADECLGEDAWSRAGPPEPIGVGGHTHGIVEGSDV